MPTALKTGSSGTEVERLQRRLRAAGFLDNEDVFGESTRRAVIAFQEAQGLLPDGIAGPVTLSALDEPGRSRPPAQTLSFDRSLRLLSGQFVDEVHPKSLIVLHHTAGASARSTFEWWNKGDQGRIAAAYLIERDGTIHETFDPRKWAFHLGLSRTGGVHDRRSIAIEMASEGPLQRKGDKLYAFGKPFTGVAYEHPAAWRGYRTFAAYTRPQEEATARLVDALCNLYGIARRMPADLTRCLGPSGYGFTGVMTHAQLRPDKTDLHPGFDLSLLQTLADLQFVST